jgi:putative ABC transport system permease protein
MLPDLRFAARSLRRQPTFVATVVLTLALGIGSTVAIFGLVDAALLRRLPFERPESILMLQGVAGPERAVRGASMPEIADWRDRSRSLASVSVYDNTSLNLRTDDGAARVNAEMVSSSFFPIVGAHAALGRTFRPEEDQVPDRDAVIVISDRLWKERFGGLPDVLGRTAILNDRAFTVIGVMPPEFVGLTFDTDVWFPASMVGITGSGSVLTNRGTRYLGALARLRDGASVDVARRDLDRVAAELAVEYSDTNRDRGVQLVPMREYYLGNTARILLMLLAAVGLLLLIACANVASLQLVRATSRGREVALRLALGAGRGRLVRQLLAESLVLALLGGVAGVLVAVWGAQALLPLVPPGVLPPFATAHVDLRLLAFAFVLCVGCGLLVGILPAWRSARRDPAFALRDGGRASSGGLGRPRRAGAQQAFVVGEIALALVLLVGAGLVARSLSRQLAVDPGIRADGVLAARVSLPRSRYTPALRVQFYERLLARLRESPLVGEVAIGSDLPMRAGTSASILNVPGRPEQGVRYYVHRVSSGYLSTLGIPLARGRDFTAADDSTAPSVVMVSEAMARRFWPDRDPVGQQIQLGPQGANGPTATIVGVAATARFRDLTTNLLAPASEPDVYFPIAQRPDIDLELAVKARNGDASSVAPVVRDAMRAIDPSLPAYALSPLADDVRSQTGPARFASVAMGAFSIIALALAAIGIYGVMAYLVSLGRREIAIRIALGATRTTVIMDTVKHAVGLALVGTALGIAGAMASTRLLGNLLFGVTPLDPATFAVVSVVVLLTAAGASWLPSRRASGVDPQEALRGD